MVIRKLYYEKDKTISTPSEISKYIYPPPQIIAEMGDGWLFFVWKIGINFDHSSTMAYLKQWTLRKQVILGFFFRINKSGVYPHIHYHLNNVLTRCFLFWSTRCARFSRTWTVLWVPQLKCLHWIIRPWLSKPCSNPN